ncbi:Uma2 family endonuclease [uncultured Nostoc sp.]|uniref:Uma2 family endonuclease n=1 Tax=uncultured Nostoc sp. TaxID=340711 RepID=UPI0035CAF8B9
MNQMPTAGVGWTIHDVELFAENEGTRYEIVDGELFVTRTPHFKHQQTCGIIFQQLNIWSDSTDLGEAVINPQGERI